MPRGRTNNERRGETVTNTYVQLRELIIEGAYSPGQRLGQEELSQRLGVGRTPLREALRMLEADGLVVSNANRGVVVASAPIAAAEELYAVRLLVEPPLLATLTGRFSDEDMHAMEEHLDQMEAASLRHRDFQSAHLEFHAVAVRRYPPTVGELVMELHRRVFWHQRVYMSRPRVTEDFVSLDRAMLAALGRGDSEAAKQLLEFHLIDAALGLIVDVEPDHRFEALPGAAAGIGIDLELDEGGVLRGPASIMWRRPCPELPELRTANLVYTPAPRKRRGR